MFPGKSNQSLQFAINNNLPLVVIKPKKRVAMFRLTFHSILTSDGNPVPITIFCNAFTTYDSYGMPGGYVFTKHSTGQKRFYIVHSGIKVETLSIPTDL
jgi:hypothetical protein